MYRCYLSFLPSSITVVFIHLFFLSSLKNELSDVSRKIIAFHFYLLKAPKCEKRKRADRIDPIARNKGCHTAVTERPSSRHYFLRIARQSILLLHEYFLSSTRILGHFFNIYYSLPFHTSILYHAPFIY